MQRDVAGTIIEIKNNFAFIAISDRSSLNLNEKEKIKVRVTEITFKTKQAPRNLISENAEVFIKKLPDNKFQVYLNSQIDLHAKFGTIISINNQNQTIVAFDGLCEYANINFAHYLSENQQKIPIDKIIDSKNNPVMIYFNADSVIEVREINNKQKYEYFLDHFVKTESGSEELTYFCMKDRKMNIYKIHESNIFINSTNIKPDENVVKKNIGALVEVSFQDNQIKAYVKIDESTINARANSYGNKTISSKPSANNIPRLPTNKSSMNGYNTVSQNIIHRHYDRKSEMYYKPKESYSESMLVLISLFETCFRFPNLDTRNVIYFKLFEITQRLGSGYTNSLDELFKIYRTQNHQTSINDLYLDISRKKAYLESVASNLIPNYLDFKLIAEMFDVVVYYHANNTWKEFHPIYKNQNQYPVILLISCPDLRIYYSIEMMEYDGFNLKTLDLTICKNVDTTSMLKSFQPNCSEFSTLFSKIFELEQLCSTHYNGPNESFYNLTSSLSESIKNIMGYVPENEYQACIETFSNIKNAKLPSRVNKCDACQVETVTKYVCSGNIKHKLCKNCALISVNREACLLCGNAINFNIVQETYHCTKCKLSYDQKYFIGIIPCYCIFDTGCAQIILNTSTCPIHQKILDKNELSWITHLLSKKI